MIRRGPKPDRFVILPNRVARERELSFRARGLLAYLLSMPEDWQTNSNRLAAESPKEGRDAVRSALAELEAAGYLRRYRIQDDAGRWRTESIITDEPRDNRGDNAAGYPPPRTDEPASVNQALIEVPTTKYLQESCTDTYAGDPENDPICGLCRGTGWEPRTTNAGLTLERCVCHTRLRRRR